MFRRIDRKFTDICLSSWRSSLKIPGANPETVNKPVTVQPMNYRQESIPQATAYIQQASARHACTHETLQSNYNCSPVSCELQPHSPLCVHKKPLHQHVLSTEFLEVVLSELLLSHPLDYWSGMSFPVRPVIHHSAWITGAAAHINLLGLRALAGTARFLLCLLLCLLFRVWLQHSVHLFQAASNISPVLRRLLRWLLHQHLQPGHAP